MAGGLVPALRRLFGPSPVEKKGLAERVRASSRMYVTPGQPYSNTWNVDRAVREAYEANPLVYRAIEVICQNAVAQRVILRKDDPDTGKIIEPGKDPSRLLYVLNRRANPWETAKIFRHRLVAQYLLSSRGVYIEVIRTNSGRIGMLNLVDPDLCDIIPSEKRDPQTNEATSSDPIGAFRVRVPGGGYDELPRFDPDADDQPSSILWVRAPHPTIMWSGMSPVQAAGMSIDLDKYARIYNRRFLQNDGRPGGLLSVKGIINRDTMERIQAQFTGGPESAGRTTVISADSVSYADTSGSPRDLMWGELSKMTKSEIAFAFGVPESVLGDASGRTFDNADAEYAMFWEHRMQPLLLMLDDQLDILTGGYDDDLYLRHDLSKVWVLGRHKREEIRTAREDVALGLRTINEYREIADLDPVPGEFADVLLVPGGKIIGTDDQELAERVAALPMLGSPQAADPSEEAQRGAEIGGVLGARLADNNVSASRLRLVAGEDRAPVAIEGRKALELEGKQGGAREEAGPTPGPPLWG